MATRKILVAYGVGMPVQDKVTALRIDSRYVRVRSLDNGAEYDVSRSTWEDGEEVFPPKE